MGKLSRLIHHLFTTRGSLKRIFNPAELERLGLQVKESEKQHGGQLVIVLEHALEPHEILRGKSAHERALEVFAQERAWDTEHNSGVLLYVLLADRTIEIIVDRGISSKLSNSVWEKVCRGIEQEFKVGNFSAGLQHGIVQISNHLKQLFPERTQQSNELADQPRII